MHVGGLAAQVEPILEGRTTQPERNASTPSTLLSQVVRWLNSALDSVTRSRVHEVTQTWNDEELGNASWNVFETSQGEKDSGGLLTKAEEEEADGLVRLMQGMRNTDRDISRQARGQLRIFCMREIHLRRQVRPSLTV